MNTTQAVIVTVGAVIVLGLVIYFVKKRESTHKRARETAQFAFDNRRYKTKSGKMSPTRIENVFDKNSLTVEVYPYT